MSQVGARILSGMLQTVTGKALNPNISPQRHQGHWRSGNWAIRQSGNLEHLIAKLPSRLIAFTWCLGGEIFPAKKCPRSDSSDRGLGRRTGEGGSRSCDYAV